MKLLKLVSPVFAAFIFIAPVMAAEKSAASDTVATGEVVKLGKITPNGPFRLWSAINRVLPAYAASTGGADLRAQVESLSVVDASGKKPGDVMVQSTTFRSVLEEIRAELKMDKIEVYKDPLGRAVTPGVVFVNAGFNMDGIVETFRAHAKKSDVDYGGFFEVSVFKGKSPSDVYALAELAVRRLRLIKGS